MLADMSGGIRAWILQHFPERQIYLRSGGEVKYYVLTTRLQVLASTLLAIMATWCLYTMVNLFFGHNPLRPAGQEVKRVQAHYQRLLADAEAKESNARLMLLEQRESFEKMAKSFEEKHQTLSQIMDSPNNLGMATADGDKLIFASNRVLMAPAIRDTAPRKARKAVVQTAELHTGLDIDRSLQSLDDTQNEILSSAENSTLDRIEAKRAIIRSLDMSVDSVLEESPFGKGGPFLPVDPNEVTVNENGFVSRVASIQARLAEVDALEQAVQSLPLGNPVGGESYRSSSFGMRNDPFTKRPTWHGGIDFVGQRQTPILATAEGTVSYVGKRGAYGRVVEIDHGHGFVTRYAHLQKTFVKRGQTVNKGEKVGGMGSTGRNTGTHLHYEVHFQGRVYDPNKFLKAGLYVQ
ncbi:M23 family metallopeptidase [Litorimonas sp. RW-G-Af-16]|uniref:M23 family metallopeptidase n=1 Tax=Litorimonas sp. RW-G-Af-16 TaxID=3241168 RepID=UPI003AAE2187